MNSTSCGDEGQPRGPGHPGGHVQATASEAITHKGGGVLGELRGRQQWAFPAPHTRAQLQTGCALPSWPHVDSCGRGRVPTQTGSFWLGSNPTPKYVS